MANKIRRLFPLHKRWTALALMLMMMTISIPALAANDFAVIYNTPRLNLRNGPSTSSAWLGAYNPGVWVEITQDSGGWALVLTPDGKTGYMSSKFLNRGIENYSTIAIVQNPKSTQFLNLRQEPSYNAQVLGIYYNGTPSLVLDENQGWYHVSVDGVQGYFRSEFLKLSATVGSDDIATIVTPNNTGLNLREGPGMQYPSIRQFKGGQYVMVINRGDGWWEVSIDGYQGFMNPDFLKEGILVSGSSGGSAPYAQVNNPNNSKGLTLWESPGINSKSLRQYVNGTRFTVLAKGSEWSYVTLEAAMTTGYMQTQYLTFFNMNDVPMMTVNHPGGGYVNLRSSPSMTGNLVLAHMRHGDAVEVLIPGTDWVKVRYGKMVGYAMASFFK